MSDQITTGQLTVGTSPTQIDGMTINAARLYVHNMDSTKDLFIGGPDVSISNGFAIGKLSTQDFLVFPEQGLYVISETGGQQISWMRMPV